MAAADQTSKAAAKLAATQATHAAKNIDKAAQLATPEAVIATTSVLRKLDPISALFGGVVTVTTLVGVGYAQKKLAQRKLEKEIENSLAEHDSRESRA